MNENSNHETYLFISEKKYIISVNKEFNQKIYLEEFGLNDASIKKPLDHLEFFLNDNIFKIEKKLIFFPAIHTVSLYIGPQHQIKYYDYIIGLKPQRVVFNPGTENQIFYDLLSNAGVFFEESCTLVLLSTNQY